MGCHWLRRTRFAGKFVVRKNRLIQLEPVTKPWPPQRSIGARYSATVGRIWCLNSLQPEQCERWREHSTSNCISKRIPEKVEYWTYQIIRRCRLMILYNVKLPGWFLATSFRNHQGAFDSNYGPVMGTQYNFKYTFVFSFRGALTTGKHAWSKQFTQCVNMSLNGILNLRLIYPKFEDT